MPLASLLRLYRSCDNSHSLYTLSAEPHHQSDEHVSNGSLDGYGNFFVFGGKHIISWNIELNNEEDVLEKNPECYHEYLSVMQQENTMLFIFYEIIEILEKVGIKLNLHEVDIPEEFML